MTRILVVEDSRTQAEVLAFVLETEGFEVEVATDGQIGLERCRGGAFNLVISDVIMPGLDGYSLCERLKNDPVTRHVPVLLLTSLAEPMDIIRGLECGADNFITKPYEAAVLVERVRHLLANHSLRASRGVSIGAELLLRGRRFVINSDKEQILDLLIATFEEVVRAREREQEAKQAAEAASRAKSTFLANLSHEIRTPMNAVLGYTQLLQRDPLMRQQQLEQLEIIAQSGEHLLNLINDVLEMSKIEAGHRTVTRADVDLSVLLDDVARLFRLRTDAKALAFEIHRAPEVPRHIVSDESKLRQILVNLLGNAVKFTERGSVIARLSVRRTEVGATRLIAEIDDTGPGIDAAELAELFRPFAQTRAGRRVTGGTGLGLAISRELARLMGGDITVESQVGRGTVFRIDLPLEIGSAPAKERTVPHSGRVVAIADQAARPRILLADDDDNSRSWLVQLLHQVGFEVREATNGVEAAAAFEEWRPELVLMDMNMPVMDGYAATRAIRARPSGRTTPIVALTASAFEDEREVIFQAGVTGWLRKPCRESDLLEEIRRHLGIEYRYAAQRATPSRQMPAVRSLMEGVPPKLAEQLREAALVADYQRLQQLISELPAEAALAAEELSRLVESFAYDMIEVLLRT